MKRDQVKKVLNLNWYVITGGPSSGKTSAIKELSRLGYIIFFEAARVFIDKEMAKGKSLEEIRGDEAKFQEEVFRLKVKVEKKAPKDKIVFFDRGLPDSIAYYQVCGLDPQKIIRLCSKKSYRKIFFLEQLPFEKDYARVEDDKIVKKLNKLLRESYINLGYIIVDIPAMSVEKGVQKILSEINRI